MLKKSHKVIDNSFVNTYTVNRILIFDLIVYIG